jgi:hypothetical protein
MSHIAFDLDALPLVPKVARSAGIGEAVVGWGLTQMWEWCWREKTDRVTTNHLRGFFGSEIGAILVDFGFLEAAGSSLWRVKGAARYLRIQAGWEKGGKAAAAAGNLKRGTKKGAAKPGAGAGGKLGVVPSSLPALPPGPPQPNASPTATSDERLATSDELKSTAPREKRAPPPRESDVILEDFAAAGLGKYQWQGAKDGTAWALLRAHSQPEEIRSRWRFGLKASGWLQVATVAQLHAKWNDIGVAMKRPAEPSKGASWTSTQPDGGKGFLEGLES